MKPWQKYLAEFFGTFVLVFIGTVAVVGAVRSDVSPLLVAPFAFGLALLAGLYAFAEVSGGHYNPAVSLGLFLDRRLRCPTCSATGPRRSSAASRLRSSFCSPPPTTTCLDRHRPGRGRRRDRLRPGAGADRDLRLVILQSSKSARYGGSALIAIPLTLLAIHFAAIPFSGSSVNPARTFGPALIGGEWDGIWIYFVAPLLGAVLAWLVYSVVVEGDTDVRDDIRALRRGAAARARSDAATAPPELFPPVARRPACAAARRAASDRSPIVAAWSTTPSAAESPSSSARSRSSSSAWARSSSSRAPASSASPSRTA